MFGSEIPGFFPSLFWGIVTLSFIVFVHEGGHFLAARLCGLEVSEFMIGLPGPKLSWKWGNTRYGITAIPFGGYVRIPALEGSGPNAELGLMTEEERAVYATVPFWKRVVTLISGIVMNLLLAIVVLTLVLTIAGTSVDRGFVNPVEDGPAAAAGLPKSAKIFSIDGVSVDNFDALIAVISDKQVGDVVRVDYAPGNEDGSYPEMLMTANVTLETHPDDTTGTTDATARPYLGVSPQYVTEPMSFGAALGQSFRFIGMTAQGIARLFTPSTFRESVDQAASVVGMSVIAAQAVKAGPWEYATLVAAISLSLGLMNLLPIPPLDGGKIVLEVVQKVTGRPINQKLLVGLSLVGFALMIFLMVYVVFNDVVKLIGS